MIDALHRRAVRLVLGLICVAAALGGCATGSTDADIQMMKIQQFRALADESKTKPAQILIIDARTADEYRAEHVEGARNIRAEQVRPESPLLPELNTFETIVVYGADPRSGGAKSVCKRLMDSTKAKIYWFQGGMQFWRKAGYPVIETAPSPQTPKPVDLTPKDNAPPPQQPMPLPPPPR